MLLHRSLAAIPGVQPLHFSWKTALFEPYDAFHVHWPETMVTGGKAYKRPVRQLLFLVFLARLRLQRIPIVRTWHNVELPRDINHWERWLILRAHKQTTLRILINESSVVDGPTELILHGHYREWFAPFELPETVPGRVTFFGAIRHYKGVPDLVRAFRTAPADPPLTLRIAGRPSSPELGDELIAAARGEERVSLRLGFLPDDELADEVGRAELVVLPYPEMHNSGAVLTTLSLGRPVLAPRTEVNTALQDEVGPGWILCFDAPLTGQAISDAILELRANPPASPPRLSRRDWREGAQRHLEAYERAVALLRGD